MITVEEPFERFPAAINKEITLKGAIIQMYITGNHVEDWYITFENGKTILKQGKSEYPDVSVTCSLDDLISISKGLMDPGRAFMSGKLTVSGDRSLAVKLLGQLKLATN